MSQPSDSPTIRYYDEHGDDFVRDTLGLDMSSLYEPFLELVPAGGEILDAGCGSGRDTRAFLERGYEVTAIDASSRMVQAATNLTGKTAILMRLEDIDYEDRFAGVWACASLLHVQRTQIDGVLSRISRALLSDGVCYVSFKEGEGERWRGARRFTDFTDEGLRMCLAHHPQFKIIHIWLTEDLRRDRTEGWVNALVRKVCI